jgi:hypothetical protein
MPWPDVRRNPPYALPVRELRLATIQIDGGPTLEVGAGDVAALRRGDRTTWRVHETLRKVYMLGGLNQ